jgi:hypothetical protein
VTRAVGDTAEARRQDKRRTAALRLMRRADLHLELTAGRKVLVQGEAPPEVVATVRELRAELCEFLEGHRCLACGGGLAGRDDVRVEGGGYVHAYCPGSRRG